jgi:hypothetical protein
MSLDDAPRVAAETVAQMVVFSTNLIIRKRLEKLENIYPCDYNEDFKRFIA